MNIAVLDIGGTSIKSGLWNGEKLIQFQETDTNAKQGGPYVIAKAIEIIRSYEAFDAIGISTAGQVDFENGSIYYANENIPDYSGMQVQRIIQHEFHVPVIVENDVNAAAVGEAKYGAGIGHKDFLCLTYGTGVGGAIITDGCLYRGNTYSAGLFGGIIVHPEDRHQGDEFSGCYERYASTTALVKKMKELDPTLDNGRKIFEAFAAGREEVKVTLDQWIAEIVTGLVTLVHIFNPSKIVLGGGILEQKYITDRVQYLVPQQSVQGFQDITISKAELGNKAGLLGIACLVESNYDKIKVE